MLTKFQIVEQKTAQMAAEQPGLSAFVCSACVLVLASIVFAILAHYGALFALFGVIWLVGFPLLILGFISFDVLIRTEYHEHHEAWIEDDKPGGFFWWSRECHWWYSPWARSRLNWRWFWKTPAWVSVSPRTMLWLGTYRFCVFAWNVGIIGIVVLMAVGGSLSR